MNIADKALSKTAELFLSVKKHNDPELTAKRIDTCNSCVHLNTKRRTCGMCGCYVDVKAKLERNVSKHVLRGMEAVESTHCPAGYWDDKELAQEYRKLYGLPPLKY